MVFREEKGRADPEGNGFPVKESAVGNGSFDAMADGVAEVQKSSRARGFLFILFNDAGLDGDIARDEFGRDVLIEWIEGFEISQHRFVPDGGVLDDFGEAFAEFSPGKSEKGIGVDENKSRLMEHADEVFSFGCIYSGFAANRRVNLGHDGGGNLNEGDASIENGSDKASQITGDSSTEGDDKGSPIVSGLNEVAAESFGFGKGFGCFAGWKFMRGCFVPGLSQGSFHGGQIMRGHIGIGDDGGFSFEAGSLNAGSGFGEEPGIHQNVVGAVSQIDVNGVHECRRRCQVEVSGLSKTEIG